MFKTHEENIIKIISANNKIVNDRIDMLEKKIGDIQESMEFTESNFKVKLTQFEDKQVEINQQMKEKLREMEDRSRRNNLRIDGVNESENESWKDTEQKTLEIFENRLGLKNIVIERAHRGRKSPYQKNTERPRTIILKLLNYQDKERIMENAKKLKNTGIFINEDFSKETIEKRKKLWETVIRLAYDNKVNMPSYDTTEFSHESLGNDFLIFFNYALNDKY